MKNPKIPRVSRNPPDRRLNPFRGLPAAPPADSDRISNPEIDPMEIAFAGPEVFFPIPSDCVRISVQKAADVSCYLRI